MQEGEWRRECRAVKKKYEKKNNECRRVSGEGSAEL
jgi:hypothetical protein